MTDTQAEAEPIPQSSASGTLLSPTAQAGAEVTTLVLVRHGETDWNRIKRIQGQIDIPLAETGHRQAALLAARLRPGLSGPIAAVLSSDLSRAMQTALPTAEALGTTVVARAGLRERHYGVFQSHDADQIAQRWPDDYARWQSHDPDFAPDQGESLRQFYTRVVTTLGEIARQYAGQTVICVAHGGVLDCAYRFATSHPLDARRQHLLLNASVNVLAWRAGSDPDVFKGDRATVITWADIAHLDEQAVTRDDT